MSKSAFHHYKQAEKMLRNGDFKTGKDLLIKTLDIDSDFYSALYRLSEIDKKLFSNIYLNKMASLDSGFSYSSPKKPSKKNTPTKKTLLQIIKNEKNTTKIKKVQDKLAEIGGEGMIVNSLPHIRYLCGFTGSSATMVVLSNSVHFITDGRYVFQSKAEVRGAEIIIDSKPHVEVIKDKKIFSSGQKIAFDSSAISHSAFLDISKQLSFVSLIETTSIIEKIAAVKDKDEIEAIKTAVEIRD